MDVGHGHFVIILRYGLSGKALKLLTPAPTLYSIACIGHVFVENWLVYADIDGFLDTPPKPARFLSQIFTFSQQRRGLIQGTKCL